MKKFLMLVIIALPFVGCGGDGSSIAPGTLSQPPEMSNGEQDRYFAPSSTVPLNDYVIVRMTVDFYDANGDIVKCVRVDDDSTVFEWDYGLFGQEYGTITPQKKISIVESGKIFTWDFFCVDETGYESNYLQGVFEVTEPIPDGGEEVIIIGSE